MSRKPISRRSLRNEETAAPSSFEGQPGGRRELAMTHFQGDFACGQRARSAPMVVVGTFATRRWAKRSAAH